MDTNDFFGGILFGLVIVGGLLYAVFTHPFICFGVVAFLLLTARK